MDAADHGSEGTPPDVFPTDEAPRRDLTDHAQWLKRLTARLVRDAHEADDLAQETLLTGLELSPPDSPRAFLRAILRNKIRAYRRTANQRSDVESMLAADRTMDLGAASTRPGELREVIEVCLGELSSPVREAMEQRYLLGLSSVEIAREKNLPEGTVRARLHRGRSQLRLALEARSSGGRDFWLGGLVPWLRQAQAKNVRLRSSGLLAWAGAWRGLLVWGVAGLVLLLGGLAILERRQPSAAEAALSDIMTGSRNAEAPDSEGPAADDLSLHPSGTTGETARKELQIDSGVSAEPGPSDSAELVDSENRAARQVDVHIDVVSETGAFTGRTTATLLKPSGNRLLAGFVPGARFALRYGQSDLVERLISGRRRAVLELLVQSPGFSSPYLLQIDPEVAVHKAIIVLVPNAVDIEGRVLSPAGNGIPGATVVAIHGIPSQTEISKGTLLKEHAPSTICDEQGRFRLSGLPDEAGSIVASAQGHADASMTLESIIRQQTPAILTLPFGGSVRGTVVGSDGTPIEEASVTFKRANEAWNRPRTAHSNAKGEFSIEHLGAGTYRTEVESTAGWLTTTVTVREGEGTDVILRLMPVELCRVRVLDAAGEALSGVQAGFFATLGEWKRRTYAVTDSEGRAMVRVPEGAQVTLSVLEAGVKFPTLEVELERTHASEHVVQKAAAKELLGRLEGQVLGLTRQEHGPSEVLMTFGGLRRILKTPIDPDTGNFRVSDLPAGEASLSVRTARAGVFDWRTLEFDGTPTTLEAFTLPKLGTLDLEWGLPPDIRNYQLAQVLLDSTGRMSSRVLSEGPAPPRKAWNMAPGAYLVRTSADGSSFEGLYAVRVRSSYSIRLTCAEGAAAATSMSVKGVPSRILTMSAEFLKLDALLEAECEQADADELEELASSAQVHVLQAAQRTPGGTFEFDVQKSRHHSWLVRLTPDDGEPRIYWLRQVPPEYLADEQIEW